MSLDQEAKNSRDFPDNGVGVQILAPDAFQRRVTAALLENPRGDVIIDFDETLFLRSSTVAYLRSAKPRVMARGVTKLVDICKPWRLSSHPDRRFVYRDWLRVLAVTILMPWSLPLWHLAIAPKLGRTEMNRALLEPISEAGGRRACVVTFGFRAVVAPLLKAGGVSLKLHAAPLFFGYRLRRRGKLDFLKSEMGSDRVAGSICVTDSEDDKDLLDACATPLLIKSELAKG